MSRAKSSPGPSASVPPGRARSRHGHPGKALTALLVLIVSALAVSLGFVLRPSKQPPAVTSGPAPLERSSKIVFDKVVLDDHKSAVRVANVQVVDFDRDGRLMDPEDPFLFWCLPIMHKNPEDPRSPLLCYVFKHAGDPDPYKNGAADQDSLDDIDEDDFDEEDTDLSDDDDIDEDANR